MVNHIVKILFFVFLLGVNSCDLIFPKKEISVPNTELEISNYTGFDITIKSFGNYINEVFIQNGSKKSLILDRGDTSYLYLQIGDVLLSLKSSLTTYTNETTEVIINKNTIIKLSSNAEGVISDIFKNLTISNLSSEVLTNVKWKNTKFGKLDYLEEYTYLYPVEQSSENVIPSSDYIYFNFLIGTSDMNYRTKEKIDSSQIETFDFNNNTEIMSLQTDEVFAIEDLMFIEQSFVITNNSTWTLCDFVVNGSIALEDSSLSKDTYLMTLLYPGESIRGIRISNDDNLEIAFSAPKVEDDNYDYYEYDPSVFKLSSELTFHKNSEHKNVELKDNSSIIYTWPSPQIKDELNDIFIYYYKYN